MIVVGEHQRGAALGDGSRDVHLVVAVRRVVAPRPDGLKNPEMATGEIEVAAEQLAVESMADPLPLYLAGDDTDGPAAWILHNNRTRVGTMFAVYDLLDSQGQWTRAAEAEFLRRYAGDVYGTSKE